MGIDHEDAEGSYIHTYECSQKAPSVMSIG